MGAGSFCGAVIIERFFVIHHFHAFFGYPAQVELCHTRLSTCTANRKRVGLMTQIGKPLAARRMLAARI
jgi:hypothetical protein